MENEENRENVESSDTEDEVGDVDNDIIEAIETTTDDGLWNLFPCRIILPGGRIAIIMMSRFTSISEINNRLDQMFAFRAYFIGQMVNGEVLPISPEATMGILDDNGTNFAIGVGTQDWDDGVEID